MKGSITTNSLWVSLKLPLSDRAKAEKISVINCQPIARHPGAVAAKDFRLRL